MGLLGRCEGPKELNKISRALGMYIRANILLLGGCLIREYGHYV
jgi:hypothetical protein